jgi:acetolactate synthase-1/2/3 large subunit
MSEIDGGELLVRMLERAGIRDVFTLHGGHLDSILMAAREHGFRLVDTRHEQAAVQAADGWARTTGRPGVAIVTAGPGVADAVSGVVNAHIDAVPLLMIGGAPPLSEDERLPLAGGFDQVALLSSVTKWAHRVPHIERIPDQVAQALRIATTGRPGPVYLEIPIDVAFARVDEERVPFPRSIQPQAAPAPPSPAGERGSPARAASSWPSRSARGSRSSRTRRHTVSSPRTTRCAAEASSTWRFSSAPLRANPTQCSSWARDSGSSPEVRAARSFRGPHD